MLTQAPIAPPIIPDSAPFTPEQRAWLNGFVAGLLARASSSAAPAAPAPLRPLTILFGSQTGTAEALAKRAAKIAGQRGFAATVVDMAQMSMERLAQEPDLLVVTSTHGDGDPPDNARALHAAMAGAKAGILSGVRFSVCGLGDTNYTQFCKAARDFDSAFERLGACRTAARGECDLEYEKPFGSWLEAVLTAIGSRAGPGPAVEEAAAESVGPGMSRKCPLLAEVAVSRKLSGEGSAKQVHHIEISLGDSGASYAAGDALGVWPQNCPSLVADIVSRLGCDGEEAVSLPDGTATSLRCALTSHCDLGKPSQDLATRFAAPAQNAGAAPLHVLDLIATRAETRLAPAELVRMLRPLAPRLYSISSSPSAHPGRVHLTVAAVRYGAHGRDRKGACSTFLADRVVPGETRASVFLHSNPAFRLPGSGETPVVMVGPGTGIAPFRSFLHERRAVGAQGRNWLFFGDQHAATDFLYSDELAELQRSGTLTRLDTAFSRDQEAKVYVQQRMLENARELYAWLEEGAHFYVCGDAARMAKDVEAALLSVIGAEGKKTASQAQEYVDGLRASKRYCRDVY